MDKIIFIVPFILGLSLTANASSIKECAPVPGSNAYYEGSIEQIQTHPGKMYHIKAEDLHMNTHLICNSSNTCTGLDIGGSYIISGEVKRNPNGDIVGYIIHRDPDNLSFSVEFMCE